MNDFDTVRQKEMTRERQILMLKVLICSETQEEKMKKFYERLDLQVRAAWKVY